MERMNGSLNIYYPPQIPTGQKKVLIYYRSIKYAKNYFMYYQHFPYVY